MNILRISGPHSLMISLAFCGMTSGVSLAATTLTLDSIASSFFNHPSGGMNSPYIHASSIQNYQVGYNATTDKLAQNWFIFEIPPLSPGESIVGAALGLYLPKFAPPGGDVGSGYGSSDLTEGFAVYGLSPAAGTFISPMAILDDDAVPDDGGLFDLWFEEVTMGPLLGEAEITKADEGTTITIPFGPDGLMTIATSTGGDILMGGALTDLTYDIDTMSPDIGEGIFHHTHPYGFMSPPGGETPAPTLTLLIIPEPSVGILTLLALAPLSMDRRRS